MERRFKSTTNDVRCAVEILNLTLEKGPAQFLAARMYPQMGDYWMDIVWCKEAANLVRAAIAELRDVSVRLRAHATELEKKGGAYEEYTAEQLSVEADAAYEAHRYLTKRFGTLLREFN